MVIISSTVARSYLTIEPNVKYVVCLRCNRLFLKELTLSRHLENIHNESKADAKQVAGNFIEAACKGVSGDVLALKKKYVLASSREHGSRTAIMPPLEGVEVLQGYACTKCALYSVTVKSLREHMEKFHTGLTKTAVDSTLSFLQCQGTVPLQTMQGGNKRSYFRVKVSVEDVKEKSAPRIGSKRKHVTISEDLETNADGGRLSTELTKASLRDARHVTREDVTIEQYSDILQAGMDMTSDGGRLQGDVSLESYNDFIACTHVQSILLSQNIDMETASNLSAQTGEKDETEKELVSLAHKYLKEVPRVIPQTAPALLNEVFPREEKSFEIVTEKSIRRYSHTLSRFLVSASRFSKSKRMPAEICGLFDTFHRLCQDGAVHDDKINCVHDILQALCLVRRRKSGGVQGLFVRIFIACASVLSSKNGETNTYRFSEAHEISHILAAMQHFILSVAVLSLYRLGDSKAPEPSCILSDVGAIETEETRIIHSVSRSENTALSYVRTVLNVCMGIMKHRTVNVTFIPCKRHENCGIIRGVELSMKDIGIFIRGWQSEANRVMKDDLLLGGCYPSGFTDIITRLRDNLHEKKNGYSFLRHQFSSEKTNNWTHWVLREISRRGSGSSMVFALHSDNGTYSEKQLNNTIPVGTHRMYAVGIEKWLNACQKLQELLLMSLHLSSGSPARASEIATFRLQNSAYGQRNIYLSQDELFTICRYSKMRSQRRADIPILRMPDYQTAQLFKSYLALFRKVEATFVGILHGVEKQKSHMEWLFVIRGNPVNAARIREIISDNMERKGKKLGISDIRQFDAEMVRCIARFSKETANEFVEEFEDVGHAQAGHSTHTADRNYGVTPRDFVGLGRREVDRSRAFCRVWHACLFSFERVTSTAVPDAGGSEIVSNELGSGTISRYERAIVAIENRLEQFIHTLGKRGTKHGNVADRESDKIEQPPSRKRKVSGRQSTGVHLFEPKPRHTESDSKILLPKLREMFGNEKACFRSAVQADITGDVLEGAEDLLVVMGTGAGKTLCVLLPVYIEGTKSCTIIITPLTALGIELEKRCHNFGISTASWRDRNKPEVQMYIFSVEHVVQEEFKRFLGLLTLQGKLKRVVVDEAHIVSTWDDFRAGMSKLKNMMNAISQPIQRVLLSATVPPNERARTMAANGMCQAVLYACPTVRKNIALSVLHTPRNVIGEGTEALLKTLIASLRSELSRYETNVKPMRVLVFVMRIRDADFISVGLQEMVTNEWRGAILTYHRGMTSAERDTSHDRWNSQDDKGLRLMVCTSAFGAGVDTDNVRLVYHFGGCNSLIQFSQESGRAGRDGKPAKSIVLWDQNFSRKQSFLRESCALNCNSLEQTEYEGRKLAWWTEMETWVMDQSTCRKKKLFSQLDGFSHSPCIYEANCQRCDVCDELYGNARDRRCQFDESEPQSQLISLEQHRGMGKQQGGRRDTRKESQRVALGTARSGSERIAQNFCSDRSTTWANFNMNRTQDEFDTAIATMFREFCRRMGSLCLRCLVFKQREVLSGIEGICDGCRQSNRRCYRCHSESHRSGDCPVPRWFPSCCNRCGLNYLNGKPIHGAGEFAKNCPLPRLNHLCWLLLNENSERDGILTEVCTNAESEMIAEQVLTAGWEAEDTRTKIFNWLHGKKGTPVQVRITCWFGWKRGYLKLDDLVGKPKTQ